MARYTTFLRVAIQVESYDVGGGNGRGRQTSRQEETGLWRRHPDADVPKAVDDSVTGQYAVGDNQFFDELAIGRKLHVSSFGAERRWRYGKSNRDVTTLHCAMRPNTW